MTDNLNVKTSSAVDNGKMAAHAGHSDAKGSTQTTHKDISADSKFNTQNKNNDPEKKDVKIPETSCRESGVNTFEAERNDRSAAAPDCDCNGTTEQIYDVT